MNASSTALAHSVHWRLFQLKNVQHFFGEPSCRRILQEENCIEWKWNWQKIIAGTWHTLNRFLACLTTVAYCSNQFYFMRMSFLKEDCSMHNNESQNQFYSCRVWNCFFFNSWLPGTNVTSFCGHFFSADEIEFACICEKIVKREGGEGKVGKGVGAWTKYL